MPEQRAVIGPTCSSAMPAYRSILLNHDNLTNKPPEAETGQYGRSRGLFQPYRSIRRSAADHTTEFPIDAAPQRVEGDSLPSFRRLASEHPEKAGEASYAFTRTIRLV